MASVDLSVDVGRSLGIRGLSREAHAEFKRIFDGLTDQVRAWLLTEWPVDTGLSLGSWEVRWSPRRLVWVIRNPVHYAEWVHPAGESEESADTLDRVVLRLFRAVMPTLREIAARDRRPIVQPQPTTRRSLFGAAVQFFQRRGPEFRQRLRERAR